MVVEVAGGHRLSGVGKGVVIVQAEDYQGVKHSVELPATIVSGLGCLLLRKEQQRQKAYLWLLS